MLGALALTAITHGLTRPHTPSCSLPGLLLAPIAAGSSMLPVTALMLLPARTG
ncbi:hypothetical protein ACFWY5_37320 [Nonomuraea sp. NPDC059007]|uniref:hypothetical protein n=1 Tax=Nonomuraea sp. NPDC059007 TaxID=3346692 RepID=UPI0036BBE9A1